MHLGTEFERRLAQGDGTMSMKVFFTVKLKSISTGSASGPPYVERREQSEEERGESKSPSMGSQVEAKLVVSKLSLLASNCGGATEAYMEGATAERGDVLRH
jgi:hypothetical protein